jgi:hypothetical protein
LAGTVEVVAMATPSSAIVNVPELEAVFTIAMFVTIQVVEAGTVARVVPVEVVAAPRKNAVGVVAIVAP